MAQSATDLGIRSSFLEMYAMLVTFVLIAVCLMCYLRFQTLEIRIDKLERSKPVAKSKS